MSLALRSPKTLWNADDKVETEGKEDEQRAGKIRSATRPSKGGPTQTYMRPIIESRTYVFGGARLMFHWGFDLKAQDSGRLETGIVRRPLTTAPVTGVTTTITAGAKFHNELHAHWSY